MNISAIIFVYENLLVPSFLWRGLTTDFVKNYSLDLAKIGIFVNFMTPKIYGWF